MEPIDTTALEYELASINVQARYLNKRKDQILGDLAEYDLAHMNGWRGGRLVPDKPLEDLPDLNVGGRPENIINDVKPS